MGLFVAVPIISAVVILTEEIWVREIEAAHENAHSTSSWPARSRYPEACLSRQDGPVTAEARPRAKRV